MQGLVLQGGPHDATEQSAPLDYGQTDVDALAPKIDIHRAVMRGRCMKSVAVMERNGLPIDINTLEQLREHWTDIQSRLIDAVDQDFGVFDGTTFRDNKWAAYLWERDILWPRSESGSLALDAEAFRQMARGYPQQMGPIQELRHTLGQMRLNDLVVGNDGRNRCLLLVFGSSSERKTLSSSKFIFGSSCWLGSLIKPELDRAVAYIDWSQQEFAVAAALSGDVAMMEAYCSGDPYLAFAKQAGAVPPGATKQSHPQERGRFKVCALAVQLGMGETSLAARLVEPEIFGQELL